MEKENYQSRSNSNLVSGISWPKAIVAAFTLAGTVAAGTWAIRGDRIEELNSKIEFFEKSGALNLPDTLISIEKTNSEIQNNLKSINDYEETKSENVRLVNLVQSRDNAIIKLEESIVQSKIEIKADADENENRIVILQDEHRKQVSALNAELDEKNAIIKNAMPHSVEFTLYEDTSKALFSSRIVVGVVDVRREDVSVTINNETKSMLVGGFQTIAVENMDCNIILDSFNYLTSSESAKFKLICTDSN